MLKIRVNIFIHISLFCFLIESCAGQNLRSQSGHVLKQDIGASVIGFLIGPILFLMSFALIWLNQKKAAIDACRLESVRKLISQEMTKKTQIDLQESIKLNKLIYRSGIVKVVEPPKDQLAELSIPGAIKIVRSVNVREFRAYRKSDKQVVYDLVWVSENEPNCEEKVNPKQNWVFQDKIWLNGLATVQEIYLSQRQKQLLPANKKFIPTLETGDKIANSTHLVEPLPKPIIQDEYIYFPRNESDINSHGSVRVKFEYSTVDVMSCICSFSEGEDSYCPFRIDLHKNGKEDEICCDGVAICCLCAGAARIMRPVQEIDYLRSYAIEQEDLIEQEMKKSRFMTLILRILTFVLMLVGVFLFFSPIVNLLGSIPLVGGFIKGTASGIVMLGALVVCIPLYILTFSIAWLVYRPKTGLILLIVVACMIVLIVILDETVKNQGQ